MAKYALFFTYTGNTIKRLIEHPGDLPVTGLQPSQLPAKARAAS